MVKNLPAKQETWVGKIPWRRKRLPPLQYSGLQNSTDIHVGCVFWGCVYTPGGLRTGWKVWRKAKGFSWRWAGGVENESGHSPTETCYKVGSSHKEEGLGELVFCLPAFPSFSSCLYWIPALRSTQLSIVEKRIQPTGEAFEWIPSSREDGEQFAWCSKFWESGNFGSLPFSATNVPKMSGCVCGLGFLVSKIKGLKSIVIILKNSCGSSIVRRVLFFLNNFIYLFLAVLGLCCCFFSSCGDRGLLSSGAGGSCGFSCCGTWAPGLRGFSTCGTWAQ